MRRTVAGGSGGGGEAGCSGGAAAACLAAARPSGRAMHSAASSEVAKLPRLTFLPPRVTCAWWGLGWPGLLWYTPK